LTHQTFIQTINTSRKQFIFTNETKKKGESITAPSRNWRFSASHDSFVVAQTFVLRMNICGKNRQLLAKQALKVAEKRVDYIKKNRK
jgi:hypothetical protein